MILVWPLIQPDRIMEDMLHAMNDQRHPWSVYSVNDALNAQNACPLCQGQCFKRACKRLNRYRFVKSRVNDRMSEPWRVTS